MQIGNRTARSEWNIGAAAIFNDRVVRSLARTAIEWRGRRGVGQRKCDNVARMRLQRPPITASPIPILMIVRAIGRDRAILSLRSHANVFTT